MNTKKDILKLIEKEAEHQKENMLQIELLKNKIKQSNKKINQLNLILKSNFNISYETPIEKEFYEFISPHNYKNITIK